MLVELVYVDKGKIQAKWRALKDNFIRNVDVLPEIYLDFIFINFCKKFTYN